MTTPLTIPKRKPHEHHPHPHIPSRNSPTSSLSSSSSTHSPTPPSGSSPSPSSYGSDERGPRPWQERRVSLLSSSLREQEHTVVNVGGPDGPPRLVTCVRSAQGFDWNQDIFLASHSDHLSLSPDLERKKDPVHEIVLTEEESRGLFPD